MTKKWLNLDNRKWGYWADLVNGKIEKNGQNESSGNRPDSDYFTSSLHEQEINHHLPGQNQFEKDRFGTALLRMVVRHGLFLTRLNALKEPDPGKRPQIGLK